MIEEYIKLFFFKVILFSFKDFVLFVKEDFVVFSFKGDFFVDDKVLD